MTYYDYDLKDDLYCTTTLNINESQTSMTEEEIQCCPLDG